MNLETLNEDVKLFITDERHATCSLLHHDCLFNAGQSLKAQSRVSHAASWQHLVRMDCRVQTLVLTAVQNQVNKMTSTRLCDCEHSPKTKKRILTPANNCIS
jgi:hypothetical protein